MWLTLALACSGDDPTDTPHSADDGPVWTVLGDDTDLPAAALLSLWGSSSDMFLVGADDGSGPVVLHYDGVAWDRAATGTTGDLWWVWSAGGDVVWFVGDGGRVVRLTRSSGTFTEEVVTDPAIKLFGVWGSAEDDVYAVGGDVNNALDGVVLHFDGTGWTEVARAPTAADGTTRRQAFKVWGSGPDDVFVVGTGALVMHFDGVAWTTAPPPVADTTQLTTVAGTAGDDVWAVGGYGNARVARFDGTSWSDLSPEPASGDPIVPGLNGVFAAEGVGTVTCGSNGAVWWVDPVEGFVEDERPVVTARSFHACRIDETGAVWAVGGDLTSLGEGVVVRGEPGVPRVSE